MNKLFNIAAAMTLITNIAFAQSNVAVGFKLGTNYSNVYSKSESVSFDDNGKFGVVAGVSLSVPIGQFIGVQPEILFSQKGFKATGSVLGSPYTLTRTTEFIDIPLMLQIRPIDMLTIVVGPQYSYLIKQKDKFENTVLSGEQTKEFNNDNLRKNLLAFIGGVDINVSKVTIGLRAGWDVQNNNGDGTKTTPRYKNAWLQGTLGFKLM